MVICSECNKATYTDYQTIQTKRKTTRYICKECYKRLFGKEVNSARDSKESTQ